MERRTILATLFATVMAGGGGAMIGAPALQTGSPYFDVLIYGGLTAVVVGSAGLAWLWFTAPPQKKQDGVAAEILPGALEASRQSVWKNVVTRNSGGHGAVIRDPAGMHIDGLLVDGCKGHGIVIGTPPDDDVLK